ncbi:MAG: hypothetical protein HY716_01990 [Planctomycetes bacterium]|nr:hypothetical protein [Planctomycetota bacterium]
MIVACVPRFISAFTAHPTERRHAMHRSFRYAIPTILMGAILAGCGDEGPTPLADGASLEKASSVPLSMSVPAYPGAEAFVAEIDRHPPADGSGFRASDRGAGPA